MYHESQCHVCCYPRIFARPNAFWYHLTARNPTYSPLPCPTVAFKLSLWPLNIVYIPSCSLSTHSSLCSYHVSCLCAWLSFLVRRQAFWQVEQCIIWQLWHRVFAFPVSSVLDPRCCCIRKWNTDLLNPNIDWFMISTTYHSCIFQLDYMWMNQFCE